MKVVLIRSTPVMPDPPVEKAANALLKAGHDVTILAWDRDSSYNQRQDNMLLPDGTAKIVRFGIKGKFGGGLKKNAFPLLRLQIRLWRWLHKHKGCFDVVHAFDFDTGFTAHKCAKHCRKKMVYHILDYYVASHNVGNGHLKKSIETAERNIINHADATIICTEKRKEQIAGTSPKRLVMIHNTPMQLETDSSGVAITQMNDSCKIAYVGVLVNGRMLKEIMNAVSEDERFELHMGGFGLLENDIKTLSEKCNRIHFYGQLLYKDTLALEKNCDLMFAIYDPTVPNHKYAAPNKFYESLMLGKPIIMAKNTGFDDIIINNDIGCVIDYTVDGLKNGLEEMLNKRSQWNEMSERSKKLYHHQYSWEIMERRLNALYDELSQ